MGETKRLIGYALAIVGIAISLLMPWWRAEAGGVTLEITLTKVQVCQLGACRSVSAGGAYGIVGLMTMAYGGLAIFALILGGILPAISGGEAKAWPSVASIVYLGFAVLTEATLDVPQEIRDLIGLERSWVYWAGVAGAVIGLVTPFLAKLGTGGAPATVLLPSRPREPTLPPPLATLSTAAAPLPRRAPVAIDLDGEAAPAPGPASAPADPAGAGAALRYVIAMAEIGEAAISARTVDGRVREVAWTELGGAIARVLDDAPPFPQTLFVDLVPRQGPPLRFTTSTTIAFAAGGTPPSGPRDALRRVLAFARAMHPDLEVEAASAEFLARGGELPTWTLRELEQYDARYRNRS